MGGINEAILMQSIYDTLFDILTYSPGAGRMPTFDKRTTLLQMVPCGQPINPDDFLGFVTPSNPGGDLTKSEYLSRMVDPVPAASATYLAKDISIESLYGSLINGATSKIKDDPVALVNYKKAFDFLNKTTKVKDWQGKETEQIDPTPLYNTYQENYSAYVTAISGFRTAYNGYDLTDPSQQRQWQANEPMLTLAVNTTYNKWQSQGAKQVDDALNVMAASINNAVNLIINDCQTNFRNSSLASNVMGLPNWHLSYTNPGNWCAPNANCFAKYTIKTSENKTQSDSNFTKYGGSTSFRWGLWSGSASFNKYNEEQNEHTEATNIEISFELAVVQIMRPWLRGDFLRMSGWETSAYSKGNVADGTINTDLVMPLMPSAFIVVKNVVIKGDFKETDMKYVKNSMSTGASIGWGPFRLSGNYESGDTSKSFSSKYQDNKIEIPGIQIIAWVSNILPFCPPNS